ncbi:hypothetical protein EK0264_15075 [Epidermidibacterium keratini]|uniref:Uncharacterized protein n=1 Tax=Epidermidibacterium keratini TaxID=1891644 RepID=A0A7L4YQE3_9ACTN|nr:hypothetical protein [Epidermidibacterium keratini]QHC01481.1 hypothetical protein EK0264_15075 [Epidermidibacterium keratini]
MPEISFSDTHQTGTRLQTTVRRDDDEEMVLWFELPWEFRPHDDLINLTLATLCGKLYDTVRLDLPASERCQATLRRITDAEVVCAQAAPFFRGNGDRTALAFSGGFDSLAAREFMPPEAELVALDFGGRFARERRFFERFEPHIVATNLVDVGMHRASWAFMTVGHILLRDVLRIERCSFGSVLEASKAFLAPAYRHQFARLPAFEYLGISIFNPVAGLTEIATVMTVLKSQPDLVSDCLESVATRGEGKYYRKQLMVRAVSHALGVSTDIADMPEPRNWFGLGDDFATDFLSPYLLAHTSTEQLAGLYSDEIPLEVLEFADQPNLDFFTRLNTTITEAEHARERQETFAHGARFDIQPYGRDDWQQLGRWRAAMVAAGMLAAQAR